MSISLDLATRANLYALQTTQSLLSRTSKRIATGLRVSAPLDDSQAFFGAAALTEKVTLFSQARANIEQATLALDTALSGLDGISRLLDNLGGVLTNLSNATDAANSDRMRSLYNQLLTQIDNLANATSYQGINLINNNVNTLNVSFSGAYGQNDLTVNAIRSDAAGFNLVTVAAGLFFSALTTLPSQSSRDSLPSWASIASMASRGPVSESPILASQDSISSSASIASVSSMGSLASTATNPSAPTQSSQPSIPSIASIASRASRAAISQALSTPSSASVASIQSLATIASLQSVVGATIPAANLHLIAGISQTLVAAKSTIQASRTTIGILNAVLLVRTEFSKNYVATAQNQIAGLTAAVLNEETANLKAMETAQLFGLQALTVTTQARSNLLRLF